ncbi:MAG: ferrous iron transport protein A [Pseudomonadota bacterium]|nr:ferrous iron transport protein A [Pseudomonadota bacterium]
MSSSILSCRQTDDDLRVDSPRQAEMRSGCRCTMIGNRSYLQIDLMSGAPVSLDQLARGQRATVARVVAASSEIDAVALRRLGELGFLPGEPVQLLRRGPGGREPLAVVIGETMFALRLLEARCIEVQPLPAGAAAA